LCERVPSSLWWKAFDEDEIGGTADKKLHGTLICCYYTMSSLTTTTEVDSRTMHAYCVEKHRKTQSCRRADAVVVACSAGPDRYRAAWRGFGRDFCRRLCLMIPVECDILDVETEDT
jgi:hypothetical protein